MASPVAGCLARGDVVYDNPDAHSYAADTQTNEPLERPV
jgi:hypothetical protein